MQVRDQERVQAILELDLELVKVVALEADAHDSVVLRVVEVRKLCGPELVVVGRHVDDVVGWMEKSMKQAE
jgi:hypothetical protein